MTKAAATPSACITAPQREIPPLSARFPPRSGCPFPPVRIRERATGPGPYDPAGARTRPPPPPRCAGAHLARRPRNRPAPARASPSVPPSPVLPGLGSRPVLSAGTRNRWSRWPAPCGDSSPRRSTTARTTARPRRNCCRCWRTPRAVCCSYGLPRRTDGVRHGDPPPDHRARTRAGRPEGATAETASRSAAPTGPGRIATDRPAVGGPTRRRRAPHAAAARTHPASPDSRTPRRGNRRDDSGTRSPVG